MWEFTRVRGYIWLVCFWRANLFSAYSARPSRCQAARRSTRMCRTHCSRPFVSPAETRWNLWMFYSTFWLVHIPSKKIYIYTYIYIHIYIYIYIYIYAGVGIHGIFLVHTIWERPTTSLCSGAACLKFVMNSFFWHTIFFCMLSTDNESQAGLSP